MLLVYIHPLNIYMRSSGANGLVYRLWVGKTLKSFFFFNLERPGTNTVCWVQKAENVYLANTLISRKWGSLWEFQHHYGFQKFSTHSKCKEQM